MGLTNVDLYRIDGNVGSLSNVQTSALNGGPLAGVRNRIINGDMRIDQRNAGATVTAVNAGYTIDRWRTLSSAASKFTVQRSSTAPAGFTNSALITSSSAYTPGAAEIFTIEQVIEGFNIADLGWGTVNAVPATLSFRVRSSLTGIFGGVIKPAGYDYAFPFTYTISAANTWEVKTINIAGPTVATFGTGNTDGARVIFGLGVGSTVSGTADGTWRAGDFYSATGATSIVSTNGATFYITGVQLEAGTVATPFERRSYGQELALCQRYFQILATGDEALIATGYIVTATTASIARNLIVEMRSTPTLYDMTSGAVRFRLNSATANLNSNTSPTMDGTIASSLMVPLVFAGFSGLTTGDGCLVRKQGSTAVLAVSSEL